MKIAQIAPLMESVPPKCYGGTERVVSWLTEELVHQGHDVTLFASGDSCTKANLVSIAESSLRTHPLYRDPLAHHILLANEVLKRVGDFDIIHSHIDYLLFPYLRMKRACALNTLHGRLDLPDLVPIYKEFSDIPVVSISDSQRKPLSMANWLATVNHGLPKDFYSFVEKPQEYLLFLGRICPEKRPDRAIRIAEATGHKLVIAAKVDRVDQVYFEEQIKPLLRSPNIDYIGEVFEHEKNELIGNAKAVLFPIDWPEPFGIVMIEALACGTPIVAFDHGSVSEIIDHEETGYICSNLDEAIKAVQLLDHIDRKRCRQTFEKRFTAKRMASDYLELYTQVVELQSDNATRFSITASTGRATIK
jgi:glycosyltransferase involved in cell wall biosynthesis